MSKLIFFLGGLYGNSVHFTRVWYNYAIFCKRISVTWNEQMAKLHWPYTGCHVSKVLIYEQRSSEFVLLTYSDCPLQSWTRDYPPIHVLYDNETKICLCSFVPFSCWQLWFQVKPVPVCRFIHRKPFALRILVSCKCFRSNVLCRLL